MTAAEKLTKITEAIARGAVVFLRTHTRATKITPRLWKRFAEAGHPVLKVAKDTSGRECLWLVSGRRYVCADLCLIEIAEAA